MLKITRFTQTENFVGNNHIITASRIQKISTRVTMNELSTKNGLRPWWNDCVKRSRTHILNTTRQAFFWLNQRVKHCVTRKFWPANIFGNILFDCFIHTWNIWFPFTLLILTFKIHSFKPLRYACKCNNWWNLQKSTTQPAITCSKLTIETTKVWNMFKVNNKATKTPLAYLTYFKPLS